ncbi:hypothetical protein BCR36DRAFT_586997 [Piromyces finnis]|uniref:MSP domain-containing protein n=1 Tax=Piromyces finnis TaxID=1754191 RepID=A0A1Y1UZN0_9FUNG|nr:hypothetical protein BCR36DRAFT_586997 [Piromyces finnis]|eukprot:ORX42870.1 hypothetical protein BCR36DRAFT_586997 [Piromyces finnis]
MSSKKFIELDPPQYLIFQRPFNVPRTRILKVKNTTDSTIVFKVKTTAPNNYIVIPNCGEVKVGEIRNVEIKRNISNEEFPPDFKCKDKFLVQSMKIDDQEISRFSDPKELQTYLMSKFQEIDKQKKINPGDVKQLLGEDRLTCVYQLPNETSAIAEAGSEELGSSRESLSNTVDATANVTAPVNVDTTTSSASKAVNEDELAAAREKIKELQQALKGFQQDQLIQDLTKNSAANARDVKTTQVKKATTSGKNVIPVEVVAIVALLAFLIGAFCF